MNRKRLAVAASLPILAALLVSAPPAMASGGDPGHEASGSCSGSTDWKIKAKPDDGRIEVELEIDSNVSGQVWAVKITDNGTKVFKGQRTTGGASGSFSVQRSIANRAGADSIVARSRDLSSGQLCVGRLTF